MMKFYIYLTIVLASTLLLAQVPQNVSYQGMLGDGSGNSVPDGNYQLTFALYATASGGSALWTETKTVTVVNGVFNVILGSDTPLNLPFNVPYWLGIKVGTGAEMQPRIELTASAYSLMSRTVADSAITSAKIAGGHVVRSINGLTDNVTLAAEGGATISSSGNRIVINAGSGTGTSAWSLTGNAELDTSNFIGTLDTAPFVIRVNNQHAVRIRNGIDPEFDAGFLPTIIGGAPGNEVSGGEQAGGSFIGGGGSRFDGLSNKIDGGWGVIVGGRANSAVGFGFVGGGNGNRAETSFATVTGGQFNRGSGRFSAVAGGASNRALGDFSIIPGGEENQARGDHSFAAGLRARANHEGSFVWSDATASTFADTFYTTNDNQFLINASGGVGIGTNAPSANLHIYEDVNSTVGLQIHNPNPGPNSKERIDFRDENGIIAGIQTSDDEAFGGYASAMSIFNNRPGGSIRLSTSGIERFYLTTDGRIGIGTNAPASLLTVAGTIESTTGGFRFPDGSIQTSAATGGGGNSWQLGGNAGTVAGTDFLGTTDDEPLEIRVDNQRVMRYEPQTEENGPNVLGGWNGNSILNNAVGVTIAGGGGVDQFGIQLPNRVTVSYGTVGGGLGNTAGSEATVGGGNSNTASSLGSTVSGGVGNIASGLYAAVPGGAGNQARGANSFAAGASARAAHDGSFVWSDRSNLGDSLVTTGENQFLINALGGVGINTNNPTSTLTVNGSIRSNDGAIFTNENDSEGLYVRSANNDIPDIYLGAFSASEDDGEIASEPKFESSDLIFRSNDDVTVVLDDDGTGEESNFEVRDFKDQSLFLVDQNGDAKLAGTLSEGSDRNSKTNIRNADVQKILRRLAGVPISTWAYINSPGVQHIGPMAQDFHAAFEVGQNETSISTIDRDGVALAAIQALHHLLQEKERRIADLEERLLRLERDFK